MKLKQYKDELKQLSVEGLNERLVLLQRELFTLKINAATSYTKDNSQFKKLKKNIARVLTILHSKIQEY
jgi:large subunit ribosomal protein L29